VLGRWALTSLGIGAVIGGGIFTLTGIAAHDWAGPALALAFVLAGTACTFAALCYAEFASILPVEGSAYAYSYGTVGEFFAWFIGWNLILEYMMGATTVAVAWSGYFEKLLHLFNINLPLYLTNDPVTAAEKVEKLRAAGQAVPDFAFAFNLPAFNFFFHFQDSGISTPDKINKQRFSFFFAGLDYLARILDVCRHGLFTKNGARAQLSQRLFNMLLVASRWGSDHKQFGFERSQFRNAGHGGDCVMRRKRAAVLCKGIRCPHQFKVWMQAERPSMTVKMLGGVEGQVGEEADLTKSDDRCTH
jgi:hypothetical protein